MRVVPARPVVVLGRWVKDVPKPPGRHVRGPVALPELGGEPVRALSSLAPDHLISG